MDVIAVQPDGSHVISTELTAHPVDPMWPGYLHPQVEHHVDETNGINLDMVDPTGVRIVYDVGGFPGRVNTNPYTSQVVVPMDTFTMTGRQIRIRRPAEIVNGPVSAGGDYPSILAMAMAQQSAQDPSSAAFVAGYLGVV